MQFQETCVVNGQFYGHAEREDGTRDLIYGPVGEQNHGHAVIDPYGNPAYHRDEDGNVSCNDRLPY